MCWPRAVSWVSSNSSLFFSFSNSFIWRSCCLCSSSSACRCACSMAARLRLQEASGPQPLLTLMPSLPPAPPPSPPPVPPPPLWSSSSCCLSDATCESTRMEVKKLQFTWLIHEFLLNHTDLMHVLQVHMPTNKTSHSTNLWLNLNTA